ncbi:MAG TPA: Hsp20/alpha crystallin family protein [Ornithinimicrobium sp.]|nr:Hsp20/alpha crystallin family protein [Ornithinimicrobium sp.]
MTRELTRTTNPLTEMLDWLDLGGPRGRRGVGLAPYVRVEDYVEDGSYVLRAEVPGLDPDEDVSVTVQGDLLTISGERREETKERHHQEFHYGSFRRTVSLPPGADPEAVEASYTDGVLEVRVPMGSEETGARTVPVTRS